MSTTAPASAAPIVRFRTLDEALARVGDVPAHRILTRPPLGTGTVLDVLDSEVTRGRGVELIDGILLEKPMGADEDAVGIWLGAHIVFFAARHNIGKTFGAQGGVRFSDGLVRIPDVSFVRWDSVDDPAELDQLPGPFLHVPPDLVVEVLSESNTAREMEIKLGEYAAFGVKLVWYVDPVAKTVTVYPKGRERGKKVLGVADTLDGGKVLPGFTLAVSDVFASRAPKPTKKKGKK